jgi:hypothetical protein
VIPKHVRIEHLRTAREAALRASAPYIDRPIDRDSIAKDKDSMRLSRAEHQKRLIEKPADTRALNTAVRVMADALVKLDSFETSEATLISKKVLAFSSGGAVGIPIWRQVQLADDLTIKSTTTDDPLPHFEMKRAPTGRKR